MVLIYQLDELKIDNEVMQFLQKDAHTTDVRNDNHLSVTNAHEILLSVIKYKDVLRQDDVRVSAIAAFKLCLPHIRDS